MRPRRKKEAFARLLKETGGPGQSVAEEEATSRQDLMFLVVINSWWESGQMDKQMNG